MKKSVTVKKLRAGRFAIMTGSPSSPRRDSPDFHQKINEDGYLAHGKVKSPANMGN